MATVTLPAVELMRVGTWNASTGRTTVLAEDLQAMVDAAQDPMVDTAPLKIGHTDPRFAATSGDGDPALGWIENLRLSDDGQTLLGDITGVPASFAEVMRTAYRRRSAEIAWKVRTAAGKAYGAVLTGLAVLGVQAPAVKGLSDVMALYSSGEIDPLNTDINALGYSVIAFSDGDDTPTIPQPIPESPERVGDQPTRGPDPIMEGAAVVAVADKVKIREALGLKADATDDDVRAALTETGIVPAVEAPETPAAPATAGAPAGETPEPAGAPASEPLRTAASAAPTTQVDAAQFAEMQNGYAAMQAKLDAIEAQKNTERRDHILNSAFAAGKVHPTNVAQFRALLDTDEEGTTTLLASMPVVMPVRELGHADSFSAGTGTDQMTDAQIAASAASYGLRI